MPAHAEMVIEGEIRPGDTFRYRPRTLHRIRAIEDTTIIEVSTPHLEDVVRLEDNYGRLHALPGGQAA